MNRWSFLWIVCLGVTGHAQTTIQEYIENIEVRSIGPAVTSGRVTAIDVDERVSGAIYVGSASGGVWKSTSGGVTWDPIFDDQPVLGIGAIKVDPVNPNYVWVGTGEGNPRNSHTGGGGIFLSQDAGKAWIAKGLEKTRNIHRIAVDPSDHETVYAAAFGNIWAPNPERGVYRTQDGGQTWKQVLFVNDTVGCADLVLDPRHPQKLVAAMYHYRREPWHFQSGGQQSGLYLTTDGGDTWIPITDKNGLPEGPLGRIGLAVAPSNPDVIYAMVEAKKTGLYKSTDGGYQWSLVTTEHVNDRPFYYHEFYVDPSNEHHLIYLHSTVSESFDGGKSWNTILPYWGVHPDHHAFWWSSQNPKHMMEGNDGGFNQSYDGGKNWVFAANLPLGQFYHINYDMEQPYNVYGGMQDNGSWKGVSRHFNEGGIRDSDWQEVAFGDGFDVCTNPTDNALVYAMSQGGYLVEVNLRTHEDRFIRPVHPNDTPLRFHWNAGLFVDPNDGSLYYGSQFLHKSTDRGASWTIISPDLTTNDSTRIQASAITGGLTPDRTSAEMYCTILCMDVRDQNILVGTDDGQVQVTRDGGNTWSLLNKSISGLPKNAWITQVHWGKHDPRTMYVVANNYRRNDDQPYCFRSTDGGQTWTNLVHNKNINGHALSLVEDPQSPQLLFVGAEHGLYCSYDGGKEWFHWNKNFPNVAVQDLKIHPRDGDLVIGTFGRGAFIIDALEPMRTLAAKGSLDKLNELELFAIEQQIMHSVKRPVGQRFPADGTFEGQNLNRAVAIMFHAALAKPNEDSAEGKSKSTKTKNPDDKPKDRSKDDVVVYIRNMAGDTLRTLKHKPDTCINTVYWSMDTKGVRWPSLRDPKEDKDEPGGGLYALPGKYEAVVVWGELRQTAVFEITNIHGQEYLRSEARASAEKFKKQWIELAELANVQMDWIRETERSIGLAKSYAVHVPDSSKKQFTALSDSLSKALDKIKTYYFLPEDATGIQDDSDKIMSYMWQALNYGDARSVAVGENGWQWLEHLRKKVQRGAEESKQVNQGLWMEWKKAYLALNPTPFKEVKWPDK
jgi:photosystem II stability/assembly factor-like uncharacterized protein